MFDHANPCQFASLLTFRFIFPIDMFLAMTAESLEENGPNNGKTCIADELLDHPAHVRTGTREEDAEALTGRMRVSVC